MITGARLRVHPAPSAERRDAWSFGSFEDGLDACRRILRRGATPAVLRLYDDVEANRSYQTGDRHVLLVYDEGDAAIIDGVMRVVAEECDALAGERADVGLVDRWFQHRNEVSALEALTRKGFVVDTMEIAARWRDLPKIYDVARRRDPERPRRRGRDSSPVPCIYRRGVPVLHVHARAVLPRSSGRRSYTPAWDPVFFFSLLEPVLLGRAKV